MGYIFIISKPALVKLLENSLLVNKCPFALIFFPFILKLNFVSPLFSSKKKKSISNLLKTSR